MAKLNNTSGYLKKAHISKEYLVVGLIFTLITNLITDWLILDINNKVFTTGIGDATSGFMWIMYATQGLSYFTDNTTLINYPVGENLWSPVYITWLLVMGPFWLLSRVISPIAASNIMLLAGFIVTALVAYYVIKRIIKSRSIAFIGAYAIAFVPYHVAKGSDHLTNVYAWVFVAIIASFIAFWRVPSWKRGFLLALSIAAACYTDGYFIYITGALLLAMTLAGIAVDIVWRQNFKVIGLKILRLLGVGLISLVILAPILWTQISASKTINSDLANARDNPRLEVSYYATRPLDLLLPPTGNVTVSQFEWYETLRDKKNGHSNDVESTNYIGYVVLSLYIAGLFVFGREIIRIRKSRDHLSIPLDKQVLGVTLISAPLVLIWMLPPVSHFGPFEFIMPTYLMAEYLPYWRVPARAFLALHPLMVIAAMVTLTVLIRNIKGNKRYILLALILLVISVEYFSTLKRPAFSTYDMPQTYSWLREQNDIDAIAEVPIVDRPIEISGYYVFGQQIHGKSLANSSLSKRAIGLLNPLGDLDNEETINFLLRRNVDAILVHDRNCKTYNWGKLVYKEEGVLPVPYFDKESKTLCTYKVDKNVVTDEYFIDAREGFSKTNYLDKNQNYFVALQLSNTSLAVVNAYGKDIDSGEKLRLSFSITTLGDFKSRPVNWSVKQQGKVIASGSTADAIYASAEVTAAHDIELSITTLEGTAIAEGEIGLGNIVISDITPEN